VVSTDQKETETLHTQSNQLNILPGAKAPGSIIYLVFSYNMLTTKNWGPYSQFDQKYYDNLKKRSYKLAEEYRQELTNPRKNAIDLGSISTEEFKKASQKHIKERSRLMAKITQQDLARAEKRKVVDLWVIWGTEKLYSQNIKTQLDKIEDIQEVWEDQDPVTWLKVTDDTKRTLSDAEQKATKENPLDLWKDDFVGYEVEYGNGKVQISLEVINELREVKGEEFKEKDDQDVIAYMLEHKHAPFND